MTLQQLLENAHMDALGLLDPGDQAAFEKAYAGAPPAIKAVVREEQARWADSFLPDVEPSPELRERVLAAVSAAMLEAGESSDLDVGEVRGTRRVHSWWRTATVAALSVCVILTAAFYKVSTDNDKLLIQITDDQAKEFWTTLGGQQMRDSLFDAGTRRVIFDPEDPAFEGEAVVWVHPQWTQARFYCYGLPAVEGEVYRIVVLDGDTVTDKLQEFASNALVQTCQFGALAQGTRLGLVRIAGDTQTLLMTATL